MNETMLEKSKRIAKPRSIAISDNLFGEIQKITKGAISVSAFLRMAAIKEIDRIKKNGWKNKASYHDFEKITFGEREGKRKISCWLDKSIILNKGKIYIKHMIILSYE